MSPTVVNVPTSVRISVHNTPPEVFDALAGVLPRVTEGAHAWVNFEADNVGLTFFAVKATTADQPEATV